MTYTKSQELRNAIENALKVAEDKWRLVGAEFKSLSGVESFSIQNESSTIPGHSYVSHTPTVDTFIAMVVDIRNSSDRLKTIRNGLRVERLQRIFYETSALFAVAEKCISWENGSITEYLGDGLLAFFKVEENASNQSFYDAHNASKNCINEGLSLINEILKQKYNLPAISIGIGLAKSKAMVTIVGQGNSQQPKAIGECVWEATKLSGGVNEIIISSTMKREWPESQNGRLGFYHKAIRGVYGYKLYNK